jgi:hypothetical protein
MYGNHLFFVHPGETPETIEFADPGFAKTRRDFCTPPCSRSGGEREPIDGSNSPSDPPDQPQAAPDRSSKMADSNGRHRRKLNPGAPWSQREALFPGTPSIQPSTSATLRSGGVRLGVSPLSSGQRRQPGRLFLDGHARFGKRSCAIGAKRFHSQNVTRRRRGVV